MGVSTGKGVYEIIRRTLSMVNRDVANHGEVVGYILGKMLECRHSYSSQELVDYIMIGILHDIGLYREADIKHVGDFESYHRWQHSVYGFLFLKYLSPIRDKAEIVLYHHVAYSKLKLINSKYQSIIEYLALADQMERYIRQPKDTLERDYFTRYRNIKFSSDALEAFYKAEAECHVIEKISDGSYRDELYKTLDEIVFSEKYRRGFFDMLIYTIDFRSEFTVIHTVSTVNFAQQLGKLLRLSSVDLNNLYYGALLHDLGKMAIPIDILESPNRLNDEEMEIMRSHVHITELILDGVVDDAVRDIAARHHEKLDGSGYYHGLTEAELTFPQQILAVADILSALYGKRSYKEGYDSEKIKAIMLNDANTGKINMKAVQCLFRNYDTIIRNYEVEKKNTVGIYLTIKQQYDAIIGKFEGLDDV